RKPVGLVYFAAADRAGRTIARRRRIGKIGRAQVRSRAVAEALTLLEALAEKASG
ncbi:MAG: CinA family protein, partial [Xanthobacteraceae bacterium]